MISPNQMVADLLIPESAVSPGIQTDEFLCPKNMLCTDDQCGAQENNAVISPRNAFCKTVSSFGAID